LLALGEDVTNLDLLVARGQLEVLLVKNTPVSAFSDPGVVVTLAGVGVPFPRVQRQLVGEVVARLLPVKIRSPPQ